MPRFRTTLLAAAVTASALGIAPDGTLFVAVSTGTAGSMSPTRPRR
jgi:hypothetical protein